jgi:hypothetical protein
MQVSLADLLGTPSEIEFEGKTYKLREPTNFEQARFTKWLHDRARNDAAQADGPDGFADRYLAVVNRNITTCVYEWGGEASVAAILTPAGMTKLLAVIIGADDPDFTEETAARMSDRKLKEAAAKILGEARTDPKAMGQLLSFLGLPPDFLNTTSSSPSPTPPSATGSTTSAG